MAKKDFVFFLDGTFSQWHPSNFIVDGVLYKNCEQYMMSKKAILFGDYDMLNKIMSTSSPAKQKALGRKVKGFDEDKWGAICKKIVYDANYAKFTQNRNMYDELMSTIGRELCEASPFDLIWGCGLSSDDPLIYNKKNWYGKNWLGEILTQLRHDLVIKNLHHFD